MTFEEVVRDLIEKGECFCIRCGANTDYYGTYGCGGKTNHKLVFPLCEDCANLSDDPRIKKEIEQRVECAAFGDPIKVSGDHLPPISLN